jgi:hypothetical protein
MIIKGRTALRQHFTRAHSPTLYFFFYQFTLGARRECVKNKFLFKLSCPGWEDLVRVRPFVRAARADNFIWP